MNLPVPGDLLDGRYEIVRVLGRGGFAIVFLARDVRVQRDVVVKVLTPDGDGYPKSVVARFHREGAVLASLRHPNTITMFDFGETDEGVLFMVFEYVEGADLYDTLKARGPLEVEPTLHILAQLLAALAEAHHAGVIHRDIKPANVLVFQQLADPFRAMLIDFGIAKTNEGWSMETITSIGTVVGTGKYMSPEQICGEPLGPQSDLYSLGLVGFEMLLGTPVVQSETLQGQLVEHLKGPPWEDLVRVDAPRSVRAFLGRLTHRDVAKRFATASDALAALEKLRAKELAHSPGPALDAPRSEAADPKRADTIQTTVSLGLLGVCVFALVGGGLMLAGGDDPEPDRREIRRDPPERVEPGVPLTPVEPVEPVESLDAGSEDRLVILDTPDAGPDRRTGCGKTTPFTGTQTRLDDQGSVRRSYAVHVPDGYDSNVQHRVLVVFHNTLSNGERAITQRRLQMLANEEGFVVVGPDSLKNVFEAWGDRDDHPFLRRILRGLDEELCLDLATVTAVGQGRGAKAAEWAACQLPIAAIATTGFRTHPEHPRCSPKRPVPVIDIWGKSDPHLPRDGGRTCVGSTVVSHARHLEQWREANACEGSAKDYLRRRDGVCRTWDCEARFVACEVEGGHQWDHGLPETIPLCAAYTTTFPYASTIWRFLKEEAVPVDPAAWFE